MSNLFLRLDFTWVKSLRSLLVSIKVINIENKYDEMLTCVLGVDIGVRMTFRKVRVKKRAIIPSSCSLLKAIERFLNVKKKVGVILNILGRFFHVNFFL